MKHLTIALCLLCLPACKASTASRRQEVLHKATMTVLSKKFYPAVDFADIKHFDHASKTYNVPHAVLSTVLHLESSGGINTRDRFERHLGTSSVGHFQVLKTTAKYIGFAPILLYQTKYNALAAAKYLSMMHKACGGKSWACGIRRYNGAGKRADAYLNKAKAFYAERFGRELE